ncbi:MAG: hypothetical protein HQL01_01555 [Nitrospirae bacterium]|nr:hypothetical protein [Nitrospirota bacterium]
MLSNTLLIDQLSQTKDEDSFNNLVESELINENNLLTEDKAALERQLLDKKKKERKMLERAIEDKNILNNKLSNANKALLQKESELSNQKDNYMMLSEKHELQKQSIILNEKEMILSSLDKKKHKYDSISDITTILVIVFIYLFPIILFPIINAKYGWDKIEPWTYYASMIYLIAVSIVPMFIGKTINPTICYQKLKQILREYMYKKNKFKIQEYLILIDEIDELREIVVKKNVIK